MSTLKSTGTRRPTGVTLLDNVARFVDGRVDIFDRRHFPFAQDWVRCQTVEEVADAIAGMVTQSHGPTIAAGYGMALSALHPTSTADPYPMMERAARRLIETRPTNESMHHMVRELLTLIDGEPAGSWSSTISAHVDEHVNQRLALADAIGRHGAALMPDNVRFLTHCWAETGIAQIVQHVVRTGKNVTAYCTETRPYLQGARLTADALRDAGADVHVLPDAAAAHLITEGGVDLAITGTDRITADGGVVNKIGTRAIAALCRAAEIPYYAICTEVDFETTSVDDVVIEMRDGREALECLGVRTATSDVTGYYPAFDRTPADLVAGYITPVGVLSRHELGAIDR